MVTYIDTTIAQFFLHMQTTGLSVFFHRVTTLGDWRIVSILAIMTCVFLVYKKRGAFVIPLIGVFVCAEVITLVIKLLVHRARPLGGYITENGFSFPSGHATVAMSFYGFLAYLLIFHFPKYKILILVFFVLVILLVGVSRLYLGVHFATDVIGGYIVGIVTLLCALRIIKRRQPTINK